MELTGLARTKYAIPRNIPPILNFLWHMGINMDFVIHVSLLSAYLVDENKTNNLTRQKAWFGSQLNQAFYVLLIC